MKRSSVGSSQKILLIDDDPNLVLLVTDYLLLCGYQVIAAANGREALAILEDQIPDIIICDVMMPEMDGFTFVQKLRQDPRIQTLPVLFLSAKAQSEDKVRGLKIGGDVYMVKPFELEELRAQIEACLNQKARHQSIHHQSVHQWMSETLMNTMVPLKVHLTPTELKIAEHVAMGMANWEIAEALNVSKRTVESHIASMFRKTGVRNRTELARWHYCAHS